MLPFHINNSRRSQECCTAANFIFLPLFRKTRHTFALSLSRGRERARERKREKRCTQATKKSSASNFSSPFPNFSPAEGKSLLRCARSIHPKLFWVAFFSLCCSLSLSPSPCHSSLLTIQHFPLLLSCSAFMFMIYFYIRKH